MSMQVIISVAGRFHAFYLAQQLLKRGYLKKLITSYPKFEVEKYGIPPEKATSIFIREVLQRGWSKLPTSLRKLYNPKFLLSHIFDSLASQKITSCDLFVGWSGNSLKALKRAQNIGARGIIERGSSHILFQQSILEEEYKKFGLKYKKIHPKVVEKELREYEQADYISIPSSFVRRTFLGKGIPEKKLIQVPYGVDLGEFRQIPKEDNVFRVVYAGSMRIRKGIHYLLEAFSELDLPNSELLLIGKMIQEIKLFFKKYQGCYKWIGHQPQKELYQYYSQGTVFVMPSIEEGLAMVQPQAMACGLPLICTTNTGGEDLIEDGKEGFVIPIRDVEALKEKIMFFYDNPEKCKQMGQAAKRKVQESFTWDDYGEKMVKEYKRILKSK